MTDPVITMPVAEAPAGHYRKKPIVIAASQWFKNGDHPLDYAEVQVGLEGGELRAFTGAEREANEWEGGIVRYYRHPDVPGDKPCEQCGKPHHIHGWIDTLEQGHRVCPGDWIITGVAGERYPCKPAIFDATYEVATEAAQTAEPLPELPWTKHWLHWDSERRDASEQYVWGEDPAHKPGITDWQGHAWWSEPLYTADQMQAYARAALGTPQ